MRVSHHFSRKLPRALVGLHIGRGRGRLRVVVMAGMRGFCVAAHLRKRPASGRGGQERESLSFSLGDAGRAGRIVPSPGSKRFARATTRRRRSRIGSSR